MSAWAVIAIVIGVLLVVAALVVGSYLGWRAYERRLLLKLVVRTEGVEAVSAALVDTMARLATASDQEIEAFADDAESMERRTLHEVRGRAGIISAEMDRLALPKRLVPAAEAIADAAYVVREQASLVRDDDRGVDTLEHVGSIDLATVRGYTEKARAFLADACDSCGLEDTAVYGGGLYL